MKTPDRIIIPKTHPPIYLMHRYWARKPHNVVAEYIKKYTKKGDIVLDPFCGSGVTIAESLFNNRKAIGIDLNPFSIFLTRNTISPVKIDLLQECYEKIKSQIEPKIKKYYTVSCPYCNNLSNITQLIWKNVNHSGEECLNEIIEEIRISCKKCNLKNHVVEKEAYKLFYEEEFQRSQTINENYEEIVDKNGLNIPTVSFSYENGNKFRQLRHYLIQNPNSNELFTKRNLIVLGLIRKTIDELNPEIISHTIKETLLLTFTANLGQSSKMVWVISKRKKIPLKKREVGSWTHHFFWNPTEFFEVNPWRGFSTRFRKTKRGKLNLLEIIKANKSSIFKPAENILDLLENNGKYNTYLLNRSSDNIPIPDKSVDYIFADPPYGDSIQYFELSSLWNGWLGFNVMNQKNHQEKEIIINSRQNKILSTYSEELKKVFMECYRVLKSEHYMTITFHNTDISIRNALISSVIEAGFVLDGLTFQMPPRNSIKSYLHYENSPAGDYFIRFFKTTKVKMNQKSLEMNKINLGALIKETLTNILNLRGEPTSGILIFNFIDEVLAKKGLFPLKNPKEISNLLNELIETGFFKLNEDGKWWFGRKLSTQINSIPLSERIKQFIVDEILENEINNGIKNIKSKQTYSEIYNVIYERFNGFLTPDRKLITELIDKIIKNRK